MTTDKITQLRIAGLRTLRDVTLDLRGLTVLIGDNGTGKSSILEALELLRQAAKPIAFMSDVVLRAHGGLESLLRRGSEELRIGVSVEGRGPRLDYDFTMGIVGTTPQVLAEQMSVHDRGASFGPRRVLDRRRGTGDAIVEPDEFRTATVGHPEGALQLPSDADGLSVGHLAFERHPTWGRLTAALTRIETHVSFETRPTWQQRELQMRGGPRWPAPLDQADSLARYGMNLPIAYYRLRNMGDETWSRVLDRARMGIGDDLRDIRLPAVGRGNIELEVVFGSAPDSPLPAEYLSEGQLCYLAFVAIVELNERRSLLAFDEPELHLHPMLLARVAWMLERVAETTPVVIATHSDRMLDALGDPLNSVVLCELDEQRTTLLRRPNAERLAEWLTHYRGVGSIRAEGYESELFADVKDKGRTQ